MSLDIRATDPANPVEDYARSKTDEGLRALCEKLVIVRPPLVHESIAKWDVQRLMANI